MKKIIMILVVVLLSGCATTWKKASFSKEYVDKNCKFAAYLPADWMYFPTANNFDMTKDGAILNNIFVQRVKFNQKLSSTKKQFAPDMLVNDLADVDIDNFRSNPKNLHFEVLENQVVALDGKDAYRFVFRFQTDEGFKKKGIIYGVNHAGILYRIGYVAAEQHYFDLNKKAFTGFIQSFRFL